MSNILIEVEDGIATITINRPDVLNALDRPTRAALAEAFAAVGADDTARAVVLTGAGERAFSAGQDLAEAQGFDADDAVAWVEELRGLYKAVRAFEKPVVGAVNGVAAGLGFQLALLTDVRVASDTARLGQTELNAGVASITGPWIMREIMGLARTLEMALTARLAPASECLGLGLVNEVVAADELLGRAHAIAAGLASKPAIALALTKRRFWEVLEPGFTEMMDAAARYHREAFASGTPQEVMRQFLAQRGKHNRRAAGG